MDQNTLTTIKEHIAELPENVRNVLMSPSLGEHLRSIAQKNKLMIDQSGDLQIQTFLLILGLKKGSDFTRNIQSFLNVTAQQAEQIAQDVSNEILLPIREEMQAFEDAAGSNEEDEHEKDLLGKTKDRAVQPPTQEEALHELENPEHLPELLPEQEIAVQKDVTPPQTRAPLQTPSPKPISFIDQKLAGVVTSPKEEKKAVTMPSSPSKPTMSDPYREPLY